MLFLNNQEVERLLDIRACIDAVEEAYAELAAQRAVNLPEGGRMDVVAPSPGDEPERAYVWGAMAGIVRSRGIFALRMKSDITYTETHDDGRKTQEKFCVEPGTYCGLVMLFSIENGEPLVIMNDGVIQHARVAATSAVAARLLARSDSASLGALGSGGMARTHAAAMAAVRPLRRIKVFSPNPDHRTAFAREMSAKLEVDVQAVDSAEQAVADADIAVCCTDSTAAVLEGEWVRPGMHLSCVLPHEIAPAAVERCDLIVRHLNGGATQAAAAPEEELPGPMRRRREPGLSANRELPTLAELVSGGVDGRTSPDQVTYYLNVPGSAIQFAAAGALVYDAARAQGVGREVPTEWFLQDIRD